MVVQCDEAARPRSAKLRPHASGAPISFADAISLSPTPETVTARAALAVLCQTYWYPLYALIRRKGYAPDEAQDLHWARKQ